MCFCTGDLRSMGTPRQERQSLTPLALFLPPLPPSICPPHSFRPPLPSVSLLLIPALRLPPYAAEAPTVQLN